MKIILMAENSSKLFCPILTALTFAIPLFGSLVNERGAKINTANDREGPRPSTDEESGCFSTFAPLFFRAQSSSIRPIQGLSKIVLQ